VRKLVSLLILSLLLNLTATVNILDDDSASWLVSYIDENPKSTYDSAYYISNLTINNTISHYSYRVAGSPGEKAVADWLENILSEWGFNVVIEEFDFISWDIYSGPKIQVFWDDNTSETFRVYPEHYSYGFNENITVQIVYLPLPRYFRYDPLPDKIKEKWYNINTSGKIVLVGREVMFNNDWAAMYFDKISFEKPIAILYTWMTENFSSYPRFHSSTGGRKYVVYRDLKLPTAWIDSTLARDIMRRIDNNETVFGQLMIPINESWGNKIENIVFTIPGRDKSKQLLITAHYDSVMTPALCDNGAGVAGVLELAQVFLKAYKENVYVPPINLTFVLFTAEEAGLIGSAMYVYQHLNELDSIVGVVNIDSIGSYVLSVSWSDVVMRTPAGESIHPEDIAEEICFDLDVPIILEPPMISSDHASFLYPKQVGLLIANWWPEITIDLSTTERRPAIMFSSQPYIPWQNLDSYRGWIHTPYDNATSTATFDWVNPTRLETQVKVIGLTILDILTHFEPVSPSGKNIDPVLVISFIGVLVVILIVFIKFRKRAI